MSRLRRWVSPETVAGRGDHVAALGQHRDGLAGLGVQDHQAHRPLTVRVKTWLKQMRYRPGLVDGFIAEFVLDLHRRNLSH